MKAFAKAPVLRSAILAAAILSLNAAVYAKDASLHFLAPGEPDAATLLPPPPALGSPEQLAELDEVRAVYHAVDSNTIAAAYSEKEFTVFNFTDDVGDYFTTANLPKTTAFFAKVQSDAEMVTDLGKNHFGRPRPFVTDPSLKNGKLEKSFSYPSGHSTESMVLALVLADLIPDKHDAIIDHARHIGWHRIQIARHYPTDIFAGRVLAMAIVDDFKKNPDYQKEFVEAQAEIAAAKK